MFNWWLGRASDDAILGDGKFTTTKPQYCLNHFTNATLTEDLEPPETPAPVFAARAFKSAIFGTPAPHDEVDFEASVMRAHTRGRAQSIAGSSPIKPQGILLTPGTGATRRKTVSFGASVVDNGAKNDRAVVPGKFPSPWTPRVEEIQQPPHRTTLTKTMEAARDGKSKKFSSAKLHEPQSPQVPRTTQGRDRHNDEARITEPVRPKDAAQDAPKISGTVAEDFDGDMTVDLNEPHSQSGRYWKSEYERYHDEAKAEMKKLVRYKQLAKSYAKKKDGEAIDLGEKLREEQQKVSKMEGKVSELSAQIAARPFNGVDDESSELVKELSRQTALAIEYRAQVDQFQVALREREVEYEQQTETSRQCFTSPKTARTLLETSRELNRARLQLAEMGSLREEMHRMRLTVSATERKVSKLQDENAKLSKQLAKVNEELDRSEKRRESAEVHNLEQDGALQRMQSDYESLKDLAKSQRRDAESLLKKRHDQVAELKREIKLLKAKAETSRSSEVEKITSGKSVGDSILSKERIAQPVQSTTMAPQPEDLMFFPGHSIEAQGELGSLSLTQRAKDTAPGWRPQSLTLTPTTVLEQVHHHRRSNGHLLDSKVPPLNRSAENYKSGKKDDSGQNARNLSANGTSRSKHNVLGEIINDASVYDSPVGYGTAQTNHLSASFQERFSNLSLSSPGAALPSSEPSFSGAPILRQQDYRAMVSPRPSMFNIPSSPPKQALSRPRSSLKDAPIQSHVNTSSSRHSSMMSSRSRIVLPPDRAAAARARLEQKNAEKRRAQEMGEQKENRV